MRTFKASRAVFVLALLMLGGGASVGATGATAGPAVSQTMPFAFAGPNPCNGEMFSATGIAHLLTSENTSTSGTTLVHNEVSVSGVEAVTLVGNKKYVVIDSEDHTFVFDTVAGFPAEVTDEVTLQFIRAGEDGSLVLGDDFYYDFRAHITVDANGTTTVSRIETEPLRCQ